MATPGGGPAPPCACSNISIMQLFHELKQQFPAVPDHVVSTTVSSHCHDRTACRRRLETEAENFASHPYPSSSVGGSRRPAPPPPSPRPLACPNRPAPPPPPLISRPAVSCSDEVHQLQESSAPESENYRNGDHVCASLDNKNHKICRSPKIERDLDKKYGECLNEQESVFHSNSEARRPNSLQLPILSSKNLNYRGGKSCAPIKHSSPRSVAFTGSGTDDVYPLDVSFNVNCHMNVLPQTSPVNLTSVNLTVCTPTSIQNVPLDNKYSHPSAQQNFSPSDGRTGFEGNVQITLSSTPSTTLRRLNNIPKNTPAIEHSWISPLEILLSKQKAQLKKLEIALDTDRCRLASMRREIRTLQSSPPSIPFLMRLRCTVQQLHASCQRLTEQLDEANTCSSEVENGGQRGSNSNHNNIDDRTPLWKCHICTFDNQPLLNKCEMCEMPRIILGRTKSVT